MHGIRFLTTLFSVMLILGTAAVYAQPSAFQGFENPADLGCWSGDGAIVIVPTGGGFYGVPSFEGTHHAEITNQHDTQAPGFGDSKFTKFCLAPMGYTGDFSQNIAVYIKANWTPPADQGDPSFWIDEAPRDASAAHNIANQPPAPGTAEHNFRLTATGTSVKVAADDQAPFTSITQTGWYVFQMTWRKDPTPTNPVLSDLRVYDATGNLVGSTVIAAHAVGSFPALQSQDLGGPGYLWFTDWQNGFASDVLAIDAASVSGLGLPPPFPFAPFVPTEFPLFFYYFFAS